VGTNYFSRRSRRGRGTSKAGKEKRSLQRGKRGIRRDTWRITKNSNPIRIKKKEARPNHDAKKLYNLYLSHNKPKKSKGDENVLVKSPEVGTVFLTGGYFFEKQGGGSKEMCASHLVAY